MSIDKRWQRIVGLYCVALIWTPYTDEEMRARQRYPWSRPAESKGRKLPLEGEITGIEGDRIYVVLDGETEPRNVAWWDVRPR